MVHFNFARYCCRNASHNVDLIMAESLTSDCLPHHHPPRKANPEGTHEKAASDFGSNLRHGNTRPPQGRDTTKALGSRSAREYEEVFAFIRFGGPPTNNHAERALHSPVKFRKVCLGSRSRTGSENVTIFSSLAETTKLQEGNFIHLFQALFADSASQAHAQIFPDRS